MSQLLTVPPVSPAHDHALGKAAFNARHPQLPLPRFNDYGRVPRCKNEICVLIRHTLTPGPACAKLGQSETRIRRAAHAPRRGQQIPD
jgi:hypothetical protein